MGDPSPFAFFFLNNLNYKFFPHPENPPLSPTPPLPPLDLTPPTQNTSELDISDNFSDPNYDNTDHDYGIPFEWPPSIEIILKL